MTDLKPCPECGYGKAVLSEGCVDCPVCGWSELIARPVPELPEGYREEHGDLWFEKDGQYLAWFSERTARVYLRNDALEAMHIQALAIWLQRRSK